MATKKSASKKATGSEGAAGTPVKAAAKKTVAKSASKKTAVKGAEVQAPTSGAQGHAAEKKAHKGHASHQDISVRAHLLAEKDHHRHHQDHYWRQAEHELASE